MRGSLERDIAPLRAVGPGGGQICGVVRVSARAPFGVWAKRSIWLKRNGTFRGKVASGLSKTTLFEKK